MVTATVLGVDGCPGGWVVAEVGGRTEVGGREAVHWHLVGSATDLVSLADATGAAMVGIDIPLGLSDSTPRTCDVEARRALGRAGSSVFPAPVRAVLPYAEDWVAARRASVAATGGTSISKQLWHIVGKIADMDAVLTPALQLRVVEVHPELALRRMGGLDELPPKRLVAGRTARLEVLANWLPDAPALVAAAPRPARPDDAIDALACAWTARRVLAGSAEIYGDPDYRDARGLAAVIHA